tara:strand:+ start:1005 stop:1424 length:420 start_codon:yes stop_codon:yes gene_type:complete
MAWEMVAKKGHWFQVGVEKYGKGAIVKSVNVMMRQHWSHTSKELKKWRLFVGNEMRANHIKKVAESSKYRLTIVSHRARLLDEDNLFASHKWVIDSLRKEKFIWDDDPKHMSLRVYQYKATKSLGEKQSTLIYREMIPE